MAAPPCWPSAAFTSGALVCLLSIGAEQLRQVVADGRVQLVQGAAFEVGAGGGQRGEVVQRVQLKPGVAVTALVQHSFSLVGKHNGHQKRSDGKHR